MAKRKAANGSGTIRLRPDGRYEGIYTVGRDPGTGKLIRKPVGHSVILVTNSHNSPLKLLSQVQWNMPVTDTDKSYLQSEIFHKALLL